MVRGPVISWVPSITCAWGLRCRHCCGKGLLLQGGSENWLYRAIANLWRDGKVGDGELETAGNSLGRNYW